MKNLLKMLILTMAFIGTINCSFAISTVKLDRFIKNSELNETATIAISVKNTVTGNTVYEQNSKKLLHPASGLKLFTAYAALDTLGYDYFFKTGFYKDSDNNLYIKLGADPLLTSGQLKQAFQKLKESYGNTFKNLYFDDSILDKKEFAPGWMWDDDVNPYTPKVSAYNLDGNIVNVNMTKGTDGFINTSLKSKYPMSVISNIQTDSKKNIINIDRYNWNNPEVVEIYGFVTSPKTIAVPLSSMRRYFIHNVEKALEDNKINITGTLYASKLLPDNAQILVEITNPITRTIPAILQNSNNLMAETIFKLAAAQKYHTTGTDELAAIVFKEFYNNNAIDADSVIIKDGCGVSRNNLMYTDWMTAALNALYKLKDFEKFKDYMAQSGDGTLTNRLYDLRGEVWLKTGSLANISAITGYVKSQDGNIYSVAILIQNFRENQKTIKDFEDNIINLIYNR